MWLEDFDLLGTKKGEVSPPERERGCNLSSGETSHGRLDDSGSQLASISARSAASTRSPRVEDDCDSSIASGTATPRRVYWRVRLEVEHSQWASPRQPPRASTPPSQGIMKVPSWTAEQFSSHRDTIQRETELERQLDEAMKKPMTTKPNPATKVGWTSWVKRPVNNVKQLFGALNGSADGAVRDK
jgi:hypothetical protein